MSISSGRSKIRSTVVGLAVTALAAAGAVTVVTITTGAPESEGDSCVRVAVDGPDGSGKTVFANELAMTLRQRDRHVIRVSVDDFHNIRAMRYRRGRESPEGFWLDSFNYGRLRADVLEPPGPGGTRRFRSAAHDLGTDAILTPEPQLAHPGAVLIVDVPFTVTAHRMALRDGTDPDPESPAMRRYTGPQRIYYAARAPQERATILMDNTDFRYPRILRS